VLHPDLCAGEISADLDVEKRQGIPDLQFLAKMESNSRFAISCKNGIEFQICIFLKKWHCMDSSITRQIAAEAKLLATQFRALCITGPRQSGKTTLSKLVFGARPYVNLENPATQAMVEQDPLTFLKQYPNGAIFDEVQRVPDLFRYLQEILDNNKDRGRFILTGSNNFLLQEQISQSLAGRVGYLQLLPLSYAELDNAGLAGNNVNALILKGGYPEIWDQQLKPEKWMPSYVQTYVQRDVRLLRNISNLGQFTRFIMLCANYAGQIVNRDEIGRAIGIDTKTVLAWLALLENSFLTFTLQPWYNNLNKRIIKSPKLYFTDTGLLCHLLGITTQTGLQQHPQYGAIYENWVISEVLKNRANQGINGGLYYFRDSAGNEVDLVMEKGAETIAVEIKAAKKVEAGMLSGLKYWLKNNRQGSCILVHAGIGSSAFSEQIAVLGWPEVKTL
jgi:uncharacterized protein